MKKYSMDDMRRVLKPVDSWWTVLIVDPIAVRLTLWTANHTSISPNLLSAGAVMLSLVSALLFSRSYLAYGAIVYEMAFLLDCVDGKLASVKGINSHIGMWLDSLSDKIRLLANILGLSIAFPELSQTAIVFVGLYLWTETESVLFREILKEAGGESILPTETCKRPLVIRLRDYARAKRISAPITLVEQDTLAFFLAPLLGMPVLGVRLAIIMNMIGRLAVVVHFWLWKYRRKTKNAKHG